MSRGRINKKKFISVITTASVVLSAGVIFGLNGFFGGGGSIPSDTFTRGLVGYWGFDEGSGSTAYDASGNGNNGTIIGDAYWMSPTGYNDPDSNWSQETTVYDENTATGADVYYATSGWGAGWIELTLSTPILSDKIRFFESSTADVSGTLVDIYYDGSWHNIYTDWIYGNNNWREVSFTKQLVEKARYRAYCDQTAPYTVYDLLKEFDFWALVPLATWTTGKIGGALQFDGANDYVSIGNVYNGVKSVEFWVKADNTTKKILGLNDTQYVEVSNRTIAATGWTSPTIYVNGVKNSTTISTTTWAHVVITTETGINATSTDLGRYSTNYFDGTLDEVRFYNRPLSDSEIRYHYNRGGPVAQWKFDEGSGQIIYDSTDNNKDGYLASSTDVSASDPAWVSGKYGTALSFDGSNDYASTTVITGASSTAYSLWFKSSDGAFSADEYLFSQGTDDPSVYLESTDNKVKVMADGADKISSNKTVNDNKWHHLEITADGNNLKLYLDGLLEAQSSYTGSSATQVFYIGAKDSTPTSLFGGIIDDVRIYNYARTPDEIRLDYNAGFSALFGPQTGCDDDPGACMTQGLVGYWSFEEGNGGQTSDISGNGNNGTLTAGPSWTTGKKGGGLSFDGVDDRLDAGNAASLNLRATLTATAWAYIPGSQTKAIVDQSADYSNRRQFIWQDVTGLHFGAGTSYWTRGTLVLGSWNFLAVTFDVNLVSDNFKAYINGVYVGAATYTSLLPSPTTSLLIGYSAPGGSTYAWNNRIDEVRIYNRALSAAEVRFHYNRGGPVAQWKFDEGSGTTAYDLTDNNNDGTMYWMSTSTSGGWTSGKYGTALSFDGTDDYISRAYDTDFDFGTDSFSISSWFKHDLSTPSTVETKQFLISGTANDPSATATGFSTLLGDGKIVWTATEANRESIIPTAGKLSNFKVGIKTAPGAGKSWTFAIRKTNTTTTLSVTISDTAVLSSLDTDEVIVAAGDKVSIVSAPSGTPTAAGAVYWTVQFTPTTDGETILLSNTEGFNLGAGFFNVLIGGMEDADEFDAQTLFPTAGTLKKFYVEVATAPGNGNSWTFTVRKNGVDQSLVVTISGTATTGNDTANTVTIAAGDKVTILEGSTGTPAASVGKFGIVFLPTTQGEYIASCTTDDPTSSTAIEYQHLNCGDSTLTGTENEQYGLAQVTTVKAIYVNLSGSPGTGYSWTFTLRRNANTTTTLAVTVSGLNTSGNYATDVAISADDLLDTSIDATAGTLTRNPQIAYLFYNAPTGATAGSDYLLSRYNGAGWKTWMDGSGNVCFGIDDDATWSPDDSICSSGKSYDDGVWHHTQVVKNGTSAIYLYVDGNRVASNTSLTATGSLSGSSPVLYLGGDLSATSTWQGAIDDMRIYNYARTPEEIRLDYNAGFAALFGPQTGCDQDPGACMTQGLVGYWGFEEGGGGQAYDASDYGNNGTLYWMSTSTNAWTKGKVGSALQFDGTDDYVNVPDSASLDISGNEITLEAWVYHRGGQDWARIIVKETVDNVSPYMTYGIYKYSNTNKVSFIIGNAALDGNAFGGYTNTELSLNSWTHITAIYNGKVPEAKIYFNGVEQSLTIDSAPTGGNIGVNNVPVVLGWDIYVSGEHYNGTIDEVRIYNRALSAAEVRYHYNRGGPVAQWKFDEGSGSVAYDATESNNDGTLYWMSTSTQGGWVEGKYGSALSFDGVDDYVNIPNSSILKPDYFTIEAWIKPPADLDGRIFLAKYSAVPAEYELAIGWSGGSCSYKLFVRSDTTSDTYYACDSVVYTTYSGWIHVAGTYDTDKKLRIYVNGALKGTSVAFTRNTSRTDPLNIGRRPYTGAEGWYRGLIDDVRIYNYARSMEQIRIDYNAGLSAHFK